VTVILDKPADWEPWFQLRREKAVVDGIWEYCDISKQKNELLVLKEPKKPSPSEVKARATTISELDAGQQAMYSNLLSDWRLERSEYMTLKRREGELLMEISRTISTRHLYLINGKDNIYDRLTALKQQLAPTDAVRSRELAIKYRALQDKPRGRNLNHWLDDWIHVTNQCKEANLPETTGHRAQDDFLTVVRTIAPEWAGSAHQVLIEKETAGKTTEIRSLADYVAQFRTYHRRVSPVAASLGTFATLGIASKSGQKEQRLLSRRKPICICGTLHYYKDCWYLLPDHPNKSEDFRPDKAKQAKVAEALKDPEQVKRINKILARDGKSLSTSLSSQEPLRIDDGKSQGSAGQSFAAFGSFSATQPQVEQEAPSIINRWILDPGSNIHVCNSTRFGWVETRKATPQDILFAGGSTVAIQAWGDVTLNINMPYSIGQIQLTNVALVESFFTNVVSLSRCRAVGVQFDSGRDLLYQNQASNVICSLEYENGHWLIDAEENDRPTLSSFAMRQAYKPSREDRRPIAVSHTEAHQLFAHASKGALDHLTTNVRGIFLEPETRGPQLQECDTCIKAKMTAQVSRREPEDRSTRPFYRIAIDLVQLVPTGETCYNGDRYLLHAVCEHSKWHEAVTLPNKSLPLVLPAVKSLINKIQRQYGYIVVVLKIDGERGYGLELYEIAKQAGFKVELRAPDTPAQLGLAEKAGNVIVTKARALRIHAGLPKSLSNELAITATRIANVTPTKTIEWRTPYELVHGRQPSVAYLATIGCKAYVLNKKLRTADKLESRTFTGYLLGYDSTNIFRIWLPKKGRVIRVRDVIFKRESLFSDEAIAEREAVSQEEIEILNIPQPRDLDVELSQLLEPLQSRHAINDGSVSDMTAQLTPIDGAEIEDPKDRSYLPTPEPSIRGNSAPPQQEEGEDTIYADMQDDEQQIGHDDESTITVRVPSQKDTIEYGPLMPARSENRQGPRRGRPQKTQSNLPKGWENSDDYIPDRQKNNAPRMTDPKVGSSSNIVAGKRARKQTNHALAAYYGAFAAAVNPTALAKLAGEVPKIQLHRDQLPPPPRRWKDLRSHPFGEEFTQAARMEIDSCWTKDCFKRTEATPTTADAEVLPLMWVFTYKFDEDGYLYKFKARLCVRGDLQETWGDTYAATLAMKVFRALVALAAAFDLQMFQFDAMNAFLNARLPRTIYCRTPEGFTNEFGELIELLRALYGLKEAPLLWYQELSSTLKKLGLKPVPGALCLFTSDRLIVFFYVDDIVVLVHPLNIATYKSFKQQLLGTYDIRELGELSWFLGIRVIRDEATHTIWMIQDSFIDKVANKFDLRLASTRYPDVPLRENHFLPSTEEPNAARTHRYQQLIGSLAYISTSTRPDVARAHSVLARHLQNPGQKHLYAAHHVWRYLIGTKNLAIRASADIQQGITSITTPEPATQELEPLFYGASDAAFADEPETRRSSQGYLFKLYGLPIDWKATVQRSVTKSTTEAELLSLSLAGSELEWWQRFFNAIRFDPEFTPSLWCDNQQTVSIATKAVDKLQTKLKHVDVHHQWVRQEVSEGRLQVEWKPTASMPADGLTKILSRQKHIGFVRQLGLNDILSKLEARTTSDDELGGGTRDSHYSD